MNPESDKIDEALKKISKEYKKKNPQRPGETTVGYVARTGAFCGTIIMVTLREEIARDENHPLQKWIQMQKGIQIINKKSGEKKVQDLLIKEIKNIDIEKYPAFYLFREMIVPIIAAQESANRAAELLSEKDYPATFTDLAKIGFFNLIGQAEGAKKTPSAGGMARSLQYEKIKADVLIAWEARSNKKQSPTAFAGFYRKNHGAEHDENGNNQKGGLPSERKIADWIRAHEKEKTVLGAGT